MNKVESILENIVQTLSAGVIPKTDNSRVGYYAATALHATVSALRELRLARVFNDPSRRADIRGTIEALQSLLSAIEESGARRSPAIAEAKLTIERFVAELRELHGDSSSAKIAVT